MIEVYGLAEQGSSSSGSSSNSSCDPHTLLELSRGSLKGSGDVDEGLWCSMADILKPLCYTELAGTFTRERWKAGRLDVCL